MGNIHNAAKDGKTGERRLVAGTSLTRTGRRAADAMTPHQLVQALDASTK